MVRPGATPWPWPPRGRTARWAAWDPWFVERDDTTGKIARLAETGYTFFGTAGSGQPYERGYLRFSNDLGRTWTTAVQVPQWNGVSEVAIARAANGDWVAACRTDILPDGRDRSSITTKDWAFRSRKTAARPGRK